MEYFQKRKKYPLPLQAVGEKSKSDLLFEELRKARAKAPPQKPWRINSWISQPTWSLIDKRAELNKTGNQSEDVKRQMNMEIKKALREDRRKRTRSIAALRMVAWRSSAKSC